MTLIDQLTEKKVIEADLHISVWEGEADWIAEMRSRGWMIEKLSATKTHVRVMLPIPIARVLVDRVRAYQGDERISKTQREGIRRDQERLLDYLEGRE